MALDNGSVRALEGQRMRRIREACRKTQTEWGRFLGVTAMTVQNIEKGHSSVTADRLRAMERCHIRACDYIVKGSADMFDGPYDEVMEAIDAGLRDSDAGSGAQTEPEAQGPTSSPADVV